MDWKKLGKQAKQIVDQRGGSDSVKADAQELRDIAKGDGSVSEKLKAAGKALREPGASGESGPAQEPGVVQEPSAGQKSGVAQEPGAATASGASNEPGGSVPPPRFSDEAPQ